MRANGLTLCAVDLGGNVISRKFKLLPYHNTDIYYQQMGVIIKRFRRGRREERRQRSRCGFQHPSIVSADGQTITSAISWAIPDFGLTSSRKREVPCIMIHDSDAAAMAELWFDHSLTDAVCVYLEMRPGGAVIVDGQLYQGRISAMHH